MSPPEPTRYVPEEHVRFIVDNLPAELREKARRYLTDQGFPLDDEATSNRPTLRAPPALESRPRKPRNRR